jgi:hypothetical protein
MPPTRPTIAQTREALLLAAQQFILVRPNALVVVADDGAETVRAATPTAPAEGLAYDNAILGTITDNPMSPQRLARAAGHRFNSYFRERLGKLVDAKLVRRTRRGYVRP